MQPRELTFVFQKVITHSLQLWRHHRWISQHYYVRDEKQGKQAEEMDEANYA